VVAHTIKTNCPEITLGHVAVRLEPAATGRSTSTSMVFASSRWWNAMRNRPQRRPWLAEQFQSETRAVASSVGHDSHNIIIAGVDEADMQVALRAIEEIQGGAVSSWMAK